MATHKQKQLQKYQRMVDELKKEIGRTRRKLLALPAKHGFRSTSELIAAIRDAAKASATGSLNAVEAEGRRARAKITAETKAGVKKLVALKKKGHEIAKHLGISLPSVQNIKRELGLVKKRG